MDFRVFVLVCVRVCVCECVSKCVNMNVRGLIVMLADHRRLSARPSGVRTHWDAPVRHPMDLIG